jgi:hypothetical protein
MPHTKSAAMPRMYVRSGSAALSLSVSVAHSFSGIATTNFGGSAAKDIFFFSYLHIQLKLSMFGFQTRYWPP